MAHWTSHGWLSVFVNWTFSAVCYSSGVMRWNVYSSVVFAGWSISLHSHCTWTGSSPINHSWYQKTRDTGLPDSEDLCILCFDTIPECDGWMEVQTDGFVVAYTALAKLGLWHTVKITLYHKHQSWQNASVTVAYFCWKNENTHSVHAISKWWWRGVGVGEEEWAKIT